MSSKKAVKAVAKLLQEGDYDEALQQSTQLIKQTKPDSPDLPQMYVCPQSPTLLRSLPCRLMYRGLALTHLKKPEETEKVRGPSIRLC